MQFDKSKQDIHDNKPPNLLKQNLMHVNVHVWPRRLPFTCMSIYYLCIILLLR